MTTNKRFSERRGLREERPEITIREAAPEPFRGWLVAHALASGFGVDELRTVVCRVLRVLPDYDQWSAGNVRFEIQSHVRSCDWFRVYDLAEAIHEVLVQRAAFVTSDTGQGGAPYFEQELNA